MDFLFHSFTLFFSLSSPPIRRKINFFFLHMTQIVNGTPPLNHSSDFQMVSSEPMKKLQTLGIANQRRICASLYLGVCTAALGCSGVLFTLGQYVPLSLACHGRDYMLQAAGSTALAILIQSFIKISCKSHRQTVSWPVIGTINPPTERVAEGCPEEGMKGDL